MLKELRNTEDYVTTTELKRTYGQSNNVKISGTLEEDFTYSHSSFGKAFYESKVAVYRRSGAVDHIPIVIAKYQKPEENAEGKLVELEGSLRSINTVGEDGKNHLLVYVYASQIGFYDDESEMKEEMNLNAIYLEGTLRQNPNLRGTPFGRIISELMVTVERCYGKHCSIPCIAWGELAYMAKAMSAGARVVIEGRLQSRLYKKEGKDKEVYEVSAFFLSAE